MRSQSPTKNGRIFLATLVILVAGIVELDACQVGRKSSDQDRESLEMRIREAGKKRIENMRRLGDRVFVDSSGFFFIDPLFLDGPGGRGTYLLRKDARVFELLAEESVLKELRLSSELSRKLGEKARELKRNWPKVVRSYSASGDLDEIAKFEAESAQFEKTLMQQLNKSQQESLKAIDLRSRLLRQGIPNLLVAEKENLGLDDDSIKRIVGQLKKIAIEVARDGNSEFVEGVQDLLPGFLQDIENEDITRLPLLPLNSLLAQLNEPDVVRQSAEKTVSTYEIQLSDGDWLFSGPRFTVNRLGEIGVSNFSSVGGLPVAALRVLNEQVRHELSDEQIDILLANYSDKSINGKIVVDNPNGSRSEVNKEIFELRKQRLQLIKDSLLPGQLHPLKNYVRIHSVFTMGPELIQKLADVDEFHRQAGFDRALKKFKERIAKFVDKSNARIAQETVRLIAENSDFNRSELTVQHIRSPSYSSYEKLIRPILQAKGEKK